MLPRSKMVPITKVVPKDILKALSGYHPTTISLEWSKVAFKVVDNRLKPVKDLAGDVFLLFERGDRKLIIGPCHRLKGFFPDEGVVVVHLKEISGEGFPLVFAFDRQWNMTSFY